MPVLMPLKESSLAIIPILQRGDMANEDLTPTVPAPPTVGFASAANVIVPLVVSASSADGGVIPLRFATPPNTSLDPKSFAAIVNSAS